MSFSETFNIGYLKTSSASNEEIFISVTPNFYFGPGIQRDGFTAPRMIDPHTVKSIMLGRGLQPKPKKELPPTANPYVQRAGTWTLFNHVNQFIRKYGKNYKIIGIQSFGDLTMNPWHVALIHKGDKNCLCHLNTPSDRVVELIHERTYRCLVKWIKGIRKSQYDFIDLEFIHTPEEDYITRIVDIEFLEKNDEWLSDKKINPENISNKIEFAFSGKPIIQKGRDIVLSNAIDRFLDVRHVFNLPTVPAHGALGQMEINEIHFGENILYNDLNARRGALNSSILVDLDARGVEVKYDDLKVILDNKHYKESKHHSPMRRGEYRLYSENTVEIFFPFNVYPFGVVGGKKGQLVCLASGGLSGRVGNTLEGIIRIMYDFFGCDDALILDEGYDTFHIVNPNQKTEELAHDDYLYENQDILNEIASFTLWQYMKDAQECKKMSSTYQLGQDIEKWPLNKSIFNDLKNYCHENGIEAKPPDELEIIGVEPHRSQMRAVLLFAVSRDKIK